MRPRSSLPPKSMTPGVACAVNTGLPRAAQRPWHPSPCTPCSSGPCFGPVGPRRSIPRIESMPAILPCNGSCSMTLRHLRRRRQPHWGPRLWLRSVCRTSCRQRRRWWFRRLSGRKTRTPNLRMTPVSESHMGVTSGKFTPGSIASGGGLAPGSVHLSSSARCR